MGFDTLIMGGRDATAIRSIFNIPECWSAGFLAPVCRILGTGLLKC